TVQSAQVIMDRDTGRSKGFGFVEMGSDQEAQTAIAAMNGKEIDGRTLTVNEARPKEGGGGGGRGFGGGGGRGGGGGGARGRGRGRPRRLRWRRRRWPALLNPISSQRSLLSSCRERSGPGARLASAGAVQLTGASVAGCPLSPFSCARFCANPWVVFPASPRQ